MAIILPAVFMGSLLCSWFQCEMFPQPPFLHVKMDNQRKLLSTITGSKIQDNVVKGPVIHTKLGLVEGFIGRSSEGRTIYKFTGIPYGESPTGHLRFRDPVPRKPWGNILRATSESPYCIQKSGTTMQMLRGQEDCLYLDVHTPKLPSPDGKNQGPGLPVIIWIPAGVFLYGKSSLYGSDYLLNEDVILVPINVRYGILGYLATGDAASPGNWALKDQALAIQWVYDNIGAFGGDPNRIIIGGISSGAASAHAMLFTKHPARNHVKGIVGLSGSSFANFGLDGKGRVLDASTVVARVAGCPTAAEGRSWEMVECLREINPYILAAHQATIYEEQPLLSQMLGPTVEPNVTNAFITELPETLYERGDVPPIPLILTRTEDETGIYQRGIRYSLLLYFRLVWYKWMPILFKLAYRNTKLGEVVTEEQGRISMRKLDSFYFGRESPPLLAGKKDFANWLKLVNDGMFNVPCWKGLELHNKITPTYSYVLRLKAFHINPIVRLLEDMSSLHNGAAHGWEIVMLFNTPLAPRLKPDSDVGIASKRLVNMIANFAAYGKPLYRNTSSGELLPLWTTIGDREHMRVLDVGLVNNISMAWDPLPSTRRMRIWEEVKF